MINATSSSRPFVLASGSASRLRLLKSVGLIPTTVWAPDVDETPLPSEAPHLYVRRIARLKAIAAFEHHPDAVIVAADTTVALGHRLFHKPINADEARRMFAFYSGRRFRVYTHVVARDAHRLSEKTIMTQATCKRLAPREIDWYIASQEWKGKGGGLCLEGSASGFIKRINGSFSNFIGLPLCETINQLASFGIYPAALEGT